jgi:hypothetical protein
MMRRNSLDVNLSLQPEMWGNRQNVPFRGAVLSHLDSGPVNQRAAPLRPMDRS